MEVKYEDKRHQLQPLQQQRAALQEEVIIQESKQEKIADMRLQDSSLQADKKAAESECKEIKIQICQLFQQWEEEQPMIEDLKDKSSYKDECKKSNEALLADCKHLKS